MVYGIVLPTLMVINHDLINQLLLRKFYSIIWFANEWLVSDHVISSIHNISPILQLLQGTE